ncbi:MAG: hypothetical protein H6779_05035 [Candidatus Nomurabacteria bacterium]|nr:hypothetical protein [Candidatus Nomurabacteria bacterium]USN87732.1 MAG: hypothetical protein H6779_05035 [Candidatus Nomurabacteria bacterium]
MEDNSLVFLSSHIALSFEKPLLSPENHYVDLNTKMKGIFGDSPDINPVPFVSNDRELLDSPVVQAVSEDGKYQLNIARGRIDFYRHATLNEIAFSDTKEDFLAKALQITEITTSSLGVKWMGFVVAYIYVNNNLKTVSHNVLNSDIVDINPGDSNSFFARNTNKINVGKVLSNNLIAIGSGTASKEKQEPVQGIMINQDFNTRASENIIDKDFVKLYIDESEKLIKVGEVLRILKIII